MISRIITSAASLRTVCASSQRCLILSYCHLPRNAVSSSAVMARRMYSPQPSPSSSVQTQSNGSAKRVTPQELLDKKHPTTESEILSSMIDGELDYDTDMGAASVNNVTAEQRAKAAAQAENTARKTIDNFNKRHL
ncbi:hypothetical protein IW140_001469 [Coemansia sp. RSA 1813]|nr:hypothetical protein EV178_003292 [Coemansia sp. RSA 1646]KAJ1771541.1 hypothetical protein LPJ74_002229 [Coemansia sp. RSA 1843]KAJ2214702.1 hypothetical protein EV179_002807 [Coemansia sp. RSA 487]KAJ2571551.1 hypothetical protein IW140_001469 [Coemansia sp. RSA 1813]